MASHPPAQCCTVGVKHDGEPTGKSIKIGNIEAYVAEPTGQTIHKDAAIIFLPDVIGIWQNSQLMADQFAANGYYTIIPDLFRGDALKINRPHDFDFPGWLAKHTVEVVDPIVEKSLAWLKEQGFKKIGSVGYCFGAKYTIRFLPKGKGIDVGYVAHPSFVEESELAAIAGPLSIAAAETDQIFPAEKRHKSETILVETKQPYQINLYSGVAHGFSVRCDTSKKIEKFAKEQAFLQAVSWFDEHLI
ncbi:alpha/beta-hydrolase [Hyaloscypha variabilis]|uniref:Alpha/beta-hydrolase n=1 Tax=Hyaloscypha variabilis (strain UAMH 11265 / GT02V1 / F) TaxID=1149755 RepID=A0A2J6QUK8_HYAVF|nr:alpha/beta-hydrolase [Hyaloscypha variabilis F]